MAFDGTDLIVGFHGQKNAVKILNLGPLLQVTEFCEKYETTTEPDPELALFCVEQPFCGRRNDCCQTHRECFSMCCSGSGMCIETKFCYSDLKETTSLISTPQSTRYEPAVNSTMVPYTSSEKKPCFQYAQYETGVTLDGVYSISKSEIYEEPLVFL